MGDAYIKPNNRRCFEWHGPYRRTREGGILNMDVCQGSSCTTYQLSNVLERRLHWGRYLKMGRLIAETINQKNYEYSKACQLDTHERLKARRLRSFMVLTIHSLVAHLDRR